MKNLKFVFIFFLIPSYLFSQTDFSSYEGQWQGKLNNSKAFQFDVEVQKLGENSYQFQIKNSAVIFETKFSFDETQLASLLIHDIHKVDLYFYHKVDLYFNEDTNEIRGFLSSSMLQYHLQLTENATGFYQGKFNLLIVPELLSENIYLTVENIQGENYEAYPFFQDNRFTGTWCGFFQKEGNKLLFQDYKTGLAFEGILEENTILLHFKFADKIIESVTLKKSEVDWQMALTPSDYAALNYPDWSKTQHQNFAHPEFLEQLENDIQSNELPNNHGIVVAQNGIIIYENYFNGFQANTLDDQRSAAKSIGSAMIGIGIEQGLIPNEQAKLAGYLPEYQAIFESDELKSQIDIKSLLTMSSGIDDDNNGSAASEGVYQSSDNWLKTVIEAPMINPPNEHSIYGSSHPFLLGVIMNQVVTEPLAIYMDKQFFAPIGIQHYIIQNDDTRKPYFGGGMYMTPQQMIRFGQLYLNKGNWKGQQILSEEWVEKSLQNYRPLENTNDKNGYGYLFWHHTYKVNGREIASIEARGAGGRYIFMIPELEVVIAITSQNFRNGKFNQPEMIVENYILPAIVGN